MKRKITSRAKSQSESHAPPAEGQEHQYARIEYWQQRYKSLTREESLFEWLYAYEAIQPLFRDVVRSLDSNVLDVGCGTSEMCKAIRDDGYRGRVVAIDLAPAAIEKLTKVLGGVQAVANQGVELLEMDATSMSFPDGEFHAGLDKATIDAMMSGEDSIEVVSKYCSEVARVLRDRGVFIMMTHLDPETEKAADALQDAILPGLTVGPVRKSDKKRQKKATDETEPAAARNQHWWFRLDVQSMEDNDEMPHVYVFTKHCVKRTRSTSHEDFDPAERFTMEHHLH